MNYILSDQNNNVPEHNINQTHEHKGFYLIEGQIIFNVEGQRIEAKTRMLVNIPPNVLHSFKNESTETAKLIIILSPAGMEQIFVEVGLEIPNNSVKPQPMDNEQKLTFARLASKYGMEIKPGFKFPHLVKLIVFLINP